MAKVKTTITNTNKIGIRLTKLKIKEKELSTATKNYEEAIKITSKNAGYFVEEMNHTIKENIKFHLHMKSKLERKLIPLRFEIAILESKIKSIYKDVCDNDTFEEAIDLCNDKLEKYIVDGYPAIQLSYSHTDKKFYF